MDRRTQLPGSLGVTLAQGALQVLQAATDLKGLSGLVLTPGGSAGGPLQMRLLLQKHKPPLMKLLDDESCGRILVTASP